MKPTQGKSQLRNGKSKVTLQLHHLSAWIQKCLSHVNPWTSQLCEPIITTPLIPFKNVFEAFFLSLATKVVTNTLVHMVDIVYSSLSGRR